MATIKMKGGKLVNATGNDWVKGKGFLMASGVFFGGYLMYLGAKAMKFEKAGTTIAIVAGLIFGAGLSGKAIKNIEDTAKASTDLPTA